MIAGLGVDLVDIARVERLLDSKGQRALSRLFSAGEITYAMARARPAMHLAARLAAKEAAFKALAGNALARRIGWREIEVANGTDGAPNLILHGSAQQRSEELDIVRLWLTLTHSNTTACAVVIAERAGPTPPRQT